MKTHPELYKIDSKDKVRVFFIEQDEEKYRIVSGVHEGRLVRSKWTEAKPKNVGKANATTAKEQADKEIDSRYRKKREDGYFDTIEEAKKGKSEGFFRPMLAYPIEELKDPIQFPIIADPKLDGMRLSISKDGMLSRKGKPVPMADYVFENMCERVFGMYPNVVLDGEIYNHDYAGRFEDLMSIIRKDPKNATPKELAIAERDMQFHVYDVCFKGTDSKLTAYQRKVWIRMVLGQFLKHCPKVKLVDWDYILSKEELEDIKKEHVGAGYEGTILRKQDGLYEHKRSYNLLKVKEFITEEFTIIDIRPGEGNRSDIAGKVIVDVDGQEVACGVKGSWEYAEDLLANKNGYIGEVATIKYFERTADNSLRFPVCIDVKRIDYEE